MEIIIKTIKLNFKPNEISPSGRIFNKENFFKKIEEKIDSGLFIVEDSDNYNSAEIDIKKILGFVDGYSVKDEEMFFHVTPINENSAIDYINECTLSLLGSKKNNGETEIKTIICLRPSPEYIFKSEKELLKNFLGY